MNIKTFMAFILGIIASGIVVYAGATFLAKDIKYKNTDVESALNELYQELNDPIVDISFYKNYQINKLKGDNYTYQSNNEDIATVDNNGLITAKSDGTVEISILKNEKKIITYNANVYKDIFKINSAALCYTQNGSCGKELTIDELSEVELQLTDRIVSKQGTYGILLRKGSYMNFTLNIKSKISFSSNSYSDGAGSSGKTAYFYKVNDDGTESLYYTLSQKNDEHNYGEYTFEPGNYILKDCDYYVEFDEWDIVPYN